MKFTFSASDTETLSRDQKVAIMEALVVAVMADLKMPSIETEWFDKEVSSIPWGMADDEIKSELTRVLAAVRKLENQDELIALMRRNAKLLAEQSLREKVLRAMGSIMFADREMLPSELTILLSYATVFEIPLDRLNEIKAVIKA